MLGQNKYLLFTAAFVSSLTMMSINPNSANAAIIGTFSQRNSWLKTVDIETKTEDFEAQNIIAPIPHNTIYDVGLFNVFYTTSGEVDQENIEINVNDSGNKRLRLKWDTRRDDATTSLQWQFDYPITALGANFRGVKDGANLTLEIGDNNVNLDEFLGTATDGKTSTSGFFGLISDTPFTTVNFTATENETFRVDNVLIPIPVPESMSTWSTILSLGIFGIPIAKRKWGIDD